ncbi:DNA-binding protein inhibitor ID-2-like [Myripristis murdjan]|uniref:DNA-binding protein inhibitor ID-2-like n=1 Tax=Myripristis murdjan TaxID=586833 RepID=UPI001175E726|nr:DNA-binding protein inhibitor ID-2-like [Myripristis murdjan]
MKAVSPVRPAGRRGGASRSKSPAEGPRSAPPPLLQDMNRCYRLLRRLVPSLPPGRAASRVEILQHVIDYILDLQTALDSGAAAAGIPRDRFHHLDPQSPATLSSDVSILTFQAGDFPRDSEVEESWTLLR